MTNHDEAAPDVPATAPDSDSAVADTQDVSQLRERIRALEDEVTALRMAVDESNSQEALVAQLREANQHLVLATVKAQTLRDEAEAANRRQNEFLAMLAHELRNPLASISMAATLLERLIAANPQLQDPQGIISRQVGHMARLLDDLLDAARINSGKITLLRQPVLLADIIASAMETVQQRIAERQQQLKIDVPAQAIVIDGDHVRLAQVFSNLLVNASKFTQNHGVISLTAEKVADDVVIRIEDTGAGIAPDVLPHIFDLFVQGPRSLARSEGGLGVGLNVVRNLVQMHEGSVEAHSAGLENGSVFTVTLPVSRKHQSIAPAPRRPAASSPGYRILVIEDNADVRNTLRTFLMLEGHMVSIADDGSSGLSMATAGEQAYDVLICDIGLPGINGYDLVKELRRRLAVRMPLAIAMSGYGQADNRTHAMAAGFDHYLVKPVDPSRLVALLAEAGLAR